MHTDKKNRNVTAIMFQELGAQDQFGDRARVWGGIPIINLWDMGSESISLINTLRTGDANLRF